MNQGVQLSQDYQAFELKATKKFQLKCLIGPELLRVRHLWSRISLLKKFPMLIHQAFAISLEFVNVTFVANVVMTHLQKLVWFFAFW